MKTIDLVECRKCGAKVHTGKKVTLYEDEEIELVVKVIGRCDACRASDERTAGAVRQRKIGRLGRIPPTA